MASKVKLNVDERKKRKKGKISQEKLNVADEFSLQDVIDLGGDETDYELLKNVDAEEDFETGETAASNEDEPTEKELKKVIKSLGLESLKSQTGLVTSVGVNTGRHMTKTDSGNVESDSDFNETSESHSRAQTEAVEVEMKERLLVHPAGRWYDEFPVEPSAEKKQDLEKMFVARMHQIAESLWENERTVYETEKEKSRSSDYEWLKTMTKSGTLGDKIASLAIQVQESPVHHLKTLDILLGMARKRGRRENLMAIDTLKDLWLVNLLPGERKLRRFREFPLTAVTKKTNKSGRDARDRKLILWYFEDQLKRRYEAFVTGIERFLHDNLENVRSKMLGIVYELLSEKPEQEKTLLLYLVNKVGDPLRKIATKAARLLGSLVQKHPNMKLVVTKEVERLLYRPNIGLKAQYYAVCFLNQLILTKRDSTLASKLIAIYFSLFKAFVDKDQVETKMLSALLSGVNRAFHYVQDDEDRFSEQVNMLFRIVHVAPFNTSVQALMLLFQVMDSRQSISDRYYQALYTKLLDSQLRLPSKLAVFLNIIYKSLKVDPSLKRLKAFVKRLLQVCSSQQPSFICGVLYLLSEIGKAKPGIKSLVTQPEEWDDDEHFTDAIDTTEGLDAPNPRNSAEVLKESERDVHRTSVHGHVFVSSSSQAQGYRANARNPLYCGAENTCLWEVLKLTKHYHPSVCRFAQSLLQDEEITYNGDPLLDFTLMRFLDRFVYKNPKKKVHDHGGSLMQPKSVSQRRFEQPVNTNAFMNKSEEQVREDEVFFYRYFKRKAEEQDEKAIKNKKGDQGEGEEELEEESDMETFGGTEVAMDFAREFENSQKRQPKKKSKSDSMEESDGEFSDGEDYNYDAMDLSEDDLDDSIGKQKRNYTDKDYEQVLLNNLSSDEFSENENDAIMTKKRKDFQSSEDLSMFAAAEEFAHLLEDSSGAGAGGSNDMNMKGVNLKQQQWELSRMGNFSKGEKSWRRRNRGKGAGESGERREKKSVGRSGRKSTQRTRNFRRKQGKRNSR